MQKLIYSLLLVVAVFAGFRVFQPDHQSSDQEGSAQESNEFSVKPWAVSNTSASPTKIEKNHHSEPTDISEVDNGYSEVDDSYCGASCLESLDLLRFQLELTDDEREKLLGNAGELAAHLRQNPRLRDELLELASTAAGDTRSVIMEVFNYLDAQARWSLGQVLIESHDWHSRFDGINFLSQPDIINKPLEQQFLDLLMTDPNYYVRSSIIEAFSQPDLFSGNQAILDALEQAVHSDPSFQVRGQALLTSTELLDDPQDIFATALGAVRSQEGDYQLYGLRALEVILKKETLETSPLSWSNRQQASAVFEDLMDSSYDDMPAVNRRYADKLFERNF